MAKQNTAPHKTHAHTVAFRATAAAPPTAATMATKQNCNIFKYSTSISVHLGLGMNFFSWFSVDVCKCAGFRASVIVVVVVAYD